MSKPNPRDVWIMDRLDKLEAQVKQYGETLTEHLEAIDALETQVRELQGHRHPGNAGITGQPFSALEDSADNAPSRPLEDDEVFHDGVIWQLDPELAKALKRG